MKEEIERERKRLKERERKIKNNRESERERERERTFKISLNEQNSLKRCRMVTSSVSDDFISTRKVV